MAPTPLGSDADRRARLVTRHRLDRSGTGADQAADAVLALHATDPATVYLSVLARCPDLTRDDVAAALYDGGSLVRLMAMRRTLFVVGHDLLPAVHHGASLEVAARLRRTLLSQLSSLPTDPELPGDPAELAAWLDALVAEVRRAAEDLGPVAGSVLGEAVPALRTAILPTTDKAYDVRRTITSPVLTLMGAQGHLVRGRPRGGWTSRQHVWEVGSRRWPGGIDPLEPAEARVKLVAAYVARFGPVTERDVTWWTGWAAGPTRTALAGVDTVETPGGLVLADDVDPVAPSEPTAALLPALDPTPMGWKQREWFLPEDPAPLYDRFGNVGPTVWWDGEVVGGWGVRPDGTVLTRLLVDRGADAEHAVRREAERLQHLLDGDPVTPSFPTPLEKQLRTS